MRVVLWYDHELKNTNTPIKDELDHLDTIDLSVNNLTVCASRTFQLYLSGLQSYQFIKIDESEVIAEETDESLILIPEKNVMKYSLE